MKLFRKKAGFTMIELLIVLTVIAIICSICMPVFTKMSESARKHSCIANMCKIRDAEDIWALENNGAYGVTPSKEDMVPNYIRSWPKCLNAEYAMAAIGSDPICPNGLTSHTLVGDVSSAIRPPTITLPTGPLAGTSAAPGLSTGTLAGIPAAPGKSGFDKSNSGKSDSDKPHPPHHITF